MVNTNKKYILKNCCLDRHRVFSLYFLIGHVYEIQQWFRLKNSFNVYDKYHSQFANFPQSFFRRISPLSIMSVQS